MTVARPRSTRLLPAKHTFSSALAAVAVLLAGGLLPHVSGVRLAYTCLGLCLRHQPYLWLSVYQSRNFNPDLPIDIIFNDPGLAESDVVKQHQEQLLFGIQVYDPSDLGGVHTSFKDHFYVQGKMTPGGNADFNLLTTQRFFALHWYMVRLNVSDVWHMENDNLLYAGLRGLTPLLKGCQARLALPFAETTQAIASLVYIGDAAALQHLLAFLSSVFVMSKQEAVKYIGDKYINDMTLLAKYYDIYEHQDGVHKLPSTNTYRPGENCLWDRYKLLFDACVVGQWVGGTWDKPGERQWWPTRNFDPRAWQWVWKDSVNGLRVPWLGPLRPLNLHVHSKHLALFLSPVNTSHVVDIDAVPPL